jgi:hypothetical protein
MNSRTGLDIPMAGRLNLHPGRAVAAFAQEMRHAVHRRVSPHPMDAFIDR